ncbi:MAG: four-carbon acid sugar kinase family protein [Leifsonia sp.]
MKTVVLDDDPTGTQSASGVAVLFDSSPELIAAELRIADSVYVQTNSRSIDERAAVALVSGIRADAIEAGRILGSDVAFVLRGDSTLRGHVFAETEVFLDASAVMVFVPAFPDGGRTTRDGVHYVRVDGVDLPANETEYADDPVFPFANADLVAYVAEKSGRSAVGFPLAELRDDGNALDAVLVAARPGTVVVPDAVTNDDIRLIAAAIERARRRGATVVVRAAAPLAAALAGVESNGLLDRPIVGEPGAVLVVCGSHTQGATAQLAALTGLRGEPVTVDTAAALADPASAAASAVGMAMDQVTGSGLAILATERVRSSEHNTLAHGERVMDALTRAVRSIVPFVDVVVSKGGITSSDVARIGIGARSAQVLGQVLPGVSVWSIEAFDGRTLTYVVVPGNVGDPSTLVDVLAAVGGTTPQRRRRRPSTAEPVG